MIRSSFFASSSFVSCGLAFALVCSVAACSPLGDSTTGDEGAMSFEYTGNGCLFGCGLERSALQGSLVSIVARGGDGEIRKTARLAGPDIGAIATQRESCTCTSRTGNTTKARSIEPSATCASGEAKACTLSVEIETARRGDAKLEIVDARGEILDRVTVHVRPAARIDAEVRQGGREVDGVYEVKRGFKVKVGSKVFDEDGNEAIFARHGVSHEYGDRSIVQPDSAVILGSTDVEDMIASGLGETSVKVRAEGAEKVIRFRVVP